MEKHVNERGHIHDRDPCKDIIHSHNDMVMSDASDQRRARTEENHTDHLYEYTILT